MCVFVYTHTQREREKEIHGEGDEEGTPIGRTQTTKEKKTIRGTRTTRQKEKARGKPVRKEPSNCEPAEVYKYSEVYKYLRPVFPGSYSEVRDGETTDHRPTQGS